MQGASREEMTKKEVHADHSKHPQTHRSPFFCTRPDAVEKNQLGIGPRRCVVVCVIGGGVTG